MIVNDTDYHINEEMRNEEYVKLSIKMGVPYSVIEDFLKGSSMSCGDLEKNFEKAKERIYKITEQRNVPDPVTVSISMDMAIQASNGIMTPSMISAFTGDPFIYYLISFWRSRILMKATAIWISI
jgi:translation initiation factor 2 alpha subunit (eIF-2alpha)